MRARKNGDEGILKLLNGCVPDRLLFNLDVPCNHLAEFQRVQLDARGGQRSSWREQA